MTIRKRTFALLGAASAISLAAPGIAIAQEVEETSESPPSSEAIVVTGSRIVSAGFEAPTPISVITTDDLIKRAPASLADALNQLPVFQNSINGDQQQFTQGNRQRTGNYLNLRNLGTQRVLVLQDGLRLPPTGTNGGIDVTLVPQMLTKRIDVVTGGASAAYGSDAVSGVVNFIIDRDFDGIKGLVQSGFATEGGKSSYRVGAAVGDSFMDDRLHVIASVEHSETKPIFKTQRTSVADSWQAVGAGTAANPFRYVEGVLWSSISDGGLISSGPLANSQFANGGTVVPFDFGTPSGNPGTQIGGDGAWIGIGCCTITPGSKTSQAFGRVDYEVSDDLRAYVSAGYNRSSNYDHPFAGLRFGFQIFNDNAYLAPATRASLGETSSFLMSKTWHTEDREFAVTHRQKSNSVNIATGFEGNLGDNLRWNAGYVHGETEFTGLIQDVNNARFYAAADAVLDGSGNVVCRVTLTNPGLYPGCVPINLFGQDSVTLEAHNYIHGISRYKATNKLDSVQATLSGDIFEGWAGPISFAVGAEYRKQSLVQVSNSDPAVAPDFTGLRGVRSSAALTFQSQNIGVADGKYNVKEAFAELNVPILTDSAVGSLDLNGAVRLTDYSTSGSVKTWKAGGTWDVFESLRLRGTLSRDIRAPSLYELFAGELSNSITFSDRLTGTQAVSRQISGGNPDLKPEIANTLTAGVVFQPDFIPGLNFSADFFRIKIKGAIATPYSPFQIIDLCYASNFTSPVCAQIDRPLGPTNPDPENTPTAIYTLNQNVATLLNSGIDFELGYRRPVGHGTVSLRAMATRQLKFQQQNAPGERVRKFVGTADFNDVQFPLPLPKWRSTISLGYDNDSFSINVQERIIGSYDRSHELVFVQNKVPTVAYTDANVTFKVPTAGDGELEVFTTVNNLFNKKPPLLPVTRTPGLTVPTMRNTYDIVGRYVTIGARIKM